MNVVTDDITLNINFDSPGSIDDKSFMIFRGWSKKENTYMFDAKVCIAIKNSLFRNKSIYIYI